MFWYIFVFPSNFFSFRTGIITWARSFSASWSSALTFCLIASITLWSLSTPWRWSFFLFFTTASASWTFPSFFRSFGFWSWSWSTSWCRWTWWSRPFPVFLSVFATWSLFEISIYWSWASCSITFGKVSFNKNCLLILIDKIYFFHFQSFCETSN